MLSTPPLKPAIDPAPVHSQGRRRLRWLLALPLLVVLGTVLQVAVLRFIDPPFSAFMVERRLGALSEGQWHFHPVYQWQNLDQIAPALPLSTIAAEDQRFATHSGFDLQAIEQARAHNEQGGRIRGGSTISQQVAKNLFLWSGRSYLRKGIEAWYTVLIEWLWPKRRILEVYVNIAEFGDGIYGAQAAAQVFWHTDASRLSAEQAARLAAVLPAPRVYSAVSPGPYVSRRAVWIQRQVRQLGGTAYLRALE